MPSQFELEASVISDLSNQVPVSVPGPAEIQDLNELAVRGLVAMFDSEKELFCFRLKRGSQGMVREGVSHRYTLITLLGLMKYEQTGRHSPIPVHQTLERILERREWLDNIGDLGLLLWLCALVAPGRVEETCQKFNVATALDRYREVRERRTMELAWFLTGLSYLAMVHNTNLAEVRQIATQTYTLLKKNQGSYGFFGHLARTGSLAGVFRGSIGSFADQVYPIYGLTKFAEAFESNEALQAARDCADAICRAQGPLGQWWWHYDRETGRVIGRYPVYSVHQDGMAPMSLFALGEAVDKDFSPWIYKGLEWVSGNNELAWDLRDPSENVIWRSVFHPDYKKYLAAVVSVLRGGACMDSQDDLMILFESRPYHFGWLLYAFAHPESPTPVGSQQ